MDTSDFRSYVLISAAYLAGFVDGEGYLALARIHRQNRSPEYCVRVAVYNTNREVLTQIQRTWGGTLSVVGRRNPCWKPSYALIWTNASAAVLLRYMSPHLRIKSRQVAALLRFQDHVRRCQRVRRPNGCLLPLTKRERLSREALFQQMKQLNARDPAVRRRHRGRRHGGEEPRTPSPRYVAGFIDAEGSLMIVKSRDRSDRKSQYRARISVANTDWCVMEDIRQGYGGILVSQGPRQIGWNPGYQLVWTDGMVGRLLLPVVPHLRIKQRQAYMLTDFLRHKRVTQQGHVGRYFAPLPAEVMALREGYYRRMGELNAKGTPVRA